MNRVRVVVVVQEMSDEEALALKKAIERLVEANREATVEVSMRPARAPGRR